MAGNDIVIIDLATKKEMRRFRDHKADVTVIMFGPQGDVLYSADADGVVVVVNVVTGKQRFKVDAGKKIVAMKLEPKENCIVVTMSDKTKKRLNSTTGKVMP